METLKTEEVLARLNIGRTTLHRWIAEGMFPKPGRQGGRRLIWSKDAVDKWQQRNLKRN